MYRKYKVVSEQNQFGHRQLKTYFLNPVLYKILFLGLH